MSSYSLENSINPFVSLLLISIWVFKDGGEGGSTFGRIKELESPEDVGRGGRGGGGLFGLLRVLEE